MPSVRLDGKAPQDERWSVIGQFRDDHSVRIMLLTLSCSTIGMDLTVATCAYLMEPHWNPTLEEQALASIYHLGQTKEVTTVRFYVRDSIEEKIMRIQDSKKNLTSLLTSHRDTGQVNDNLDGLHVRRPPPELAFSISSHDGKRSTDIMTEIAQLTVALR